MRKKWMVTGTSLMMTAALVVSGCAGDGGKEGASKPEEKSAAKKVQFPLEQPIQLKMFANVPPQIKKDMNDMQMFKELNKQTNVQVSWTQVGWEQLAEKKNILIASGDLPDAFYGRGVLLDQEIVKLGSQGALIPLEGMIDQYAPNLKKVLDQRPEFKKMMTAPDGHIYTLPTFVERDFNEIPSVLFINKKWLDQLGLPVPKTTDEFYNALKAFKEKDPNGNGKNDEIPMSFLFNNAQNGANALAGSFGIKSDDPRNNLYVDNGKVKYSPAQPEYETYMQYMSKLYKERLIDQEVFTHNMNQYLTKIRSKDVQVGAFFGYSLMSIFGDNKTDYVPVLPLKGPDGKQPSWLRMPTSPNLGAFAITSANKHPEVTMQWLDTMYDEKLSFQFESGPFGLTSKENPDGTIEKLPTPQGVGADIFKHSEAPGNAAVVLVLKNMVDKYIDAQADEKRSYFKMYEPYASKDIIPNLLWSLEDSEKLNNINLELNGKNGYYASTYAKFVMDGFTKADWENHQAQLKKLKVDEYVSLYQKYYDAYMSKK
ncbi:extracellular solute-binding protein [Paenibacillus sp. YYML68]|uniref:extracellular solute-binding protein n=1 Tax=Paenibacillus sp. YYML68 TaxID=2909250 RepID=UPI0024935510|nr:extracellular solute-binding protein [Paenibacillus sp. YYML68]